MPRILACTTRPGDWQAFLADPAKHWRTGYSAKALAHSWEAADGFPPEICLVLSTAADGALDSPVPFLGIPEWRTELPGGDRPSQTDLLVIGRAAGGPFTIAVEGKMSESFGPTIGEWRRDGSTGKAVRWSFLCSTLGLPEDVRPDLRYQLFHRSVSAILAARQFHATIAVLLVHSFSQNQTGWRDYATFLQLFGADAIPNSLDRLGAMGPVRFYAGWVAGNLRFTLE